MVVQIIDDQHGGRFHLGHRVTNNGDGTWHYEYALHNLNSHQSARLFTVPIPTGVNVTATGFHDVDYHSGEPFDGTDWTITVGANDVTWSTQTFAENENANALRWGTLYNFRFDADSPPTHDSGTIGLFRPGAPDALVVGTLAPSGTGAACPWDLDGDGNVGVSDLLLMLAGWGEDPGGPPDFDGDGTVGVADLLELLGRWGPCPAFAICGESAAGNCFTDHGTPGCNSQACCDTVCTAEPSCCETAWDESCATLALQLCGNCGQSSAGSCCQANGTPGCNSISCCEAVCEADPFCCTVEWDQMCASEAQKLCGCL